MPDQLESGVVCMQLSLYAHLQPSGSGTTMAQKPRLEPGPDQARRARTLRAAARSLDRQGRDKQLASLLDAIATACEHTHQAPVISLDECLRWGGVSNTALMIAREIDKGVDHDLA